MATNPKSQPKKAPPHAARVGVAELRGNLAKYLKQAKSGEPVIIQDRGRSAYMLVKLEEENAPSAFGCMRDRTEYVAGEIINASEAWPAGRLP